MPRVAIDYSKTVIYRISHKEIAGLDYVGSTTDFTRRKGKHKSCCNNTESTKHHLKVYQVIRDNGGWDAFRMLEVKKFPCGDRREAESEEEKCRQELKATLNTHRAFVDKKEYGKQYYEQHKDQIAEHKKEYREQHKDQIAEYREQHKDQIAEHKKQYYEQHKDIIKKMKAKTYTCECCQSSLRLNDKARHDRSERHIKNAQTA